MQRHQIGTLLALCTFFMLESCGNPSPSTSVSASGSSATSPAASASVASSSSASVSSSAQASSSGTPSSSTEKKALSFREVATLLTTCAQTETTDSSAAHIVRKEASSDTIDTSDETFTLLKDGSSFSKGTLTREEKSTQTLADTFSRRYLKKTDKIKVSGQAVDYPMFYRVTDYDKNSFTSNSYQDSAEKLFVVNDAETATKQGLSDGEYLLTSDCPAAATAQVCTNLAQFIVTDLINNDYVTQLGLTDFTADGTNYSLSAEYSYDGDLNDTLTQKIEMNLAFNDDRTSLINGRTKVTSTDVSKSDSTDSYVKSSSYEGSLTYLTKGSEAAPLNVDDYFVSSITALSICNSDAKRTEADPKAFSLESSYLFAFAKNYLPAKAKNTGLVNVSSSDAKVIALTTDGYFEVVGVGKTTLVFSYFGRDDQGIYEERQLTQEVTVVEPNGTSLSLLTATPAINENTLYLGTSYKIGTYIAPSKANQTVSVSSSDSAVLKAVAGDNNVDVVLTPVAAGTATITVTSTAYPSLVQKVTYTIKNPLADDYYLSKLTTNDYLFTTTLFSNYSFRIHFKTDGTGTRVQTLTDTGESYTDTFSYTLKGTALTFTNWSDKAPHAYEKGTIKDNGDTMVLEDANYNSDGYSIIK